MKRGKFDIRCRESICDGITSPWILSPVSGYISEERGIGIYLNHTGEWAVTDLKTGTFAYGDVSLIKAYKWYAANEQKIIRKRKERNYISLCEIFESIRRNYK